MLATRCPRLSFEEGERPQHKQPWPKPPTVAEPSAALIAQKMQLHSSLTVAASWNCRQPASTRQATPPAANALAAWAAHRPPDAIVRPPSVKLPSSLAGLLGVRVGFACLRACVCACVRACVRACARERVCVCARMHACMCEHARLVPLFSHPRRTGAAACCHRARGPPATAAACRSAQTRDRPASPGPWRPQHRQGRRWWPPPISGRGRRPAVAFVRVEGQSAR